MAAFPDNTRSPATRSADHDPSWQRAYNEGLAFEQKRRKWISRFFRKKYGDELGELMEMPLKDGWPRLESLAMEGDKLAGEALIDLGCLPQRAWQFEPARLTNSLGRDLRPDEQAFFLGALTAELETQRDFQAQCETGGFGTLRMRQLVESKAGPLPSASDANDPLIEWSRVIDAFRYLYGQHDLPAPQDDSLQSTSARLRDLEHPPHPNDVEALIAEVDRDPHALEQFALCLQLGCNGIPAQPAEERLSWSLRAARFGGWLALNDVVTQTRASGDLVTADAWAGFARWLSLAGCGVVVNAGTVAEAMRTVDMVSARTTAAERAEADARAQQLIARYGAQARAAQGCD